MRPHDTGMDLDEESVRDVLEGFKRGGPASATYLKSLGGAEEADMA